jgi:hypothetical protein
MSDTKGVLTHNQYRQRLLNDYDRLIAYFEGGLERSGDTFLTWLTPMDGKLVLAALREAKSSAMEIPIQ